MPPPLSYVLACACQNIQSEDWRINTAAISSFYKILTVISSPITAYTKTTAGFRGQRKCRVVLVRLFLFRSFSPPASPPAGRSGRHQREEDALLQRQETQHGDDRTGGLRPLEPYKIQATMILDIQGNGRGTIHCGPTLPYKPDYYINCVGTREIKQGGGRNGRGMHKRQSVQYNENLPTHQPIGGFGLDDNPGTTRAASLSHSPRGLAHANNPRPMAKTRTIARMLMKRGGRVGGASHH